MAAGRGAADAWRRWRARRPAMEGLHLDTAAAGRSSRAVLRAAAAHARREATVGAYVAAAEASPVLETGRAQLASLLGISPGGLAFVESASAARQALLTAWPLHPGDTVAVVPSEWGPNLWDFEARGLRVIELATRAHGLVDLEVLEGALAGSRLALVHLTQVASHRALVQPVGEVAALCRAAGVALWVDAAQALGHVDSAGGADAIYATSRKWMTGPRGVGMLGVAEPWWDRLRTSASPLARSTLTDASPVRLLESHEANVAGRVGLCAAVRELIDAGPSDVWRRLAEVGQLTRGSLADVPGWEVVDPPGVPSAITALRATGGQDVVATRERLLNEHGIVTTACGRERAPGEMAEPLLRVSPHVDCLPEELNVLRERLTQHRR